MQNSTHSKAHFKKKKKKFFKKEHLEGKGQMSIGELVDELK